MNALEILGIVTLLVMGAYLLGIIDVQFGDRDDD